MSVQDPPEGLSPPVVADLAPREVTAVEQLGKDRQKAKYAYAAITMRGSGDGSDEPAGRFRATPDGELFAYRDGIWVGSPDGEQRLRELGQIALEDHYGRNVLKELVEQVRSKEPIKRPELGVPRGTVATPDGLFCLEDVDDEDDLEPGDVRELEPGDYALGKISVSPDLEAPIEDSRWWGFVEESVPDPTERAKLQEYAGYTLLPRQPYKKALFIVGPTDSGKGTFLKAIESVLGAENVAHQSLHSLINSRWGTDKIYGKMANVANEVSPGAVKRVERFKELTGGEDTVTAERKGQPTYEFKVTQKFLFATNQFPSVPHADEAFWNRCLFVEFPNSVPTEEKDPALLDRLQEERPTILNWMIDGLRRLLKRGHFSGERDIEERRALTKSFGSPVDQFVFEAVDVTGEPKDVIHQGDLYEAFTRFCHFQEFNETPIKQTFTKRIARRPGVSSGQSRRVNGQEDRPHVYKGLQPVPELFRRIQADMPRHATAAEGGGDGDGDGDRRAKTGQTRMSFS